MYNKLINVLEIYTIFFHNQFGFRQRHSTHHTLITLVDKITESLDHGDIVIGIFLDLKKAFDTILIKKVYYYGKSQLSRKYGYAEYLKVLFSVIHFSFFT